MATMLTKGFAAWDILSLETQINKWIETNPLAPGTFAFHYAASVLEKTDVQSRTQIEYSAMIVYVPFSPVGGGSSG